MSWLWKSDPSSPASFEKALAKLSTQLTSANLSLEVSRSRARRVKALWTLYTILAYLISVAVLVLVLGPQKWYIPHYVGLVGAPILIYGIRTLLRLFFDWQIGRKQSHVEDLQKQRETKINDLKKATKYDSTQELLQKYGSAPKQTPSKPQQGTKRKIASPHEQPQRTGLPPPPTANIVRPGASLPNTPQRQDSLRSGEPPQRPESSQSPSASPVGVFTEEPGFAPNAFGPVINPPKSAYDRPSNWWDRILDVVLGDDETLARNRLALICSKCRLVNGQAPPGIQTLEQIGVWRCSNCGTTNGVESEPSKSVKEGGKGSEVKDGEWQQTSRSDGYSSTENAKHVDHTAEELSPNADPRSMDVEEDLTEELPSRATGTDKQSRPEDHDVRTTRRNTRGGNKQYDDDDQGW